MRDSKYFILAILLLSTLSLCGQRFSLLLEAGALKSQMDGDKIQGFYNNGYNVGIGSYYTFTPQHFLAVKSTFYDQGSSRKNEFQPKLREGFQMEVDLKSIGIELSYKFDPKSQPYFGGLGLVRHQVVGLDYQIIDNEIEEETRMLTSNELRNGFTSVKFFYGINFSQRTGIYVAFESAISDLIKQNFFEIQSLIPYSIAAVFTYEIIAAEEVKTKKRPGSKRR